MTSPVDQRAPVVEVRWRFGGAVVTVGALEGGDVQVVAVRFGLDFSVLPIQVSGDPAAPAMAIGWRAADQIRNCLTTLEATSWRRHL